jgi:hypothetical protein
MTSAEGWKQPGSSSLPISVLLLNAQCSMDSKMLGSTLEVLVMRVQFCGAAANY